MDSLKIVFIPNLPYTYRDHQRFGVEYFYNKGYDVEVLDIHKFFLPGYAQKVAIDYFKFDKYYEMDRENEFLEKISNLTKDDFIFFYLGGNAKLLLSKMRNTTDARFITYVGGSIPITSHPCSIIKKIKMKLYNIKKRLEKQLFYTDYYISGCKYDEDMLSEYISDNTKIIRSNSRDYNLSLETISFKYHTKYCVFLDTDVIDASDYVLDGNKAHKDIDGYFNKLFKFFNWIKDKFHIDVIIAAHPKTRLFLNKEELDGIKIVHGKSAQLVKGCEFVINEGTTAISYAILFDKPSVFFTMKEISFFEHTCSFTKVLDKEIINIDNLDKDTYRLFIKELNNTQQYEKYKYNYLTYDDNKRNTFQQLEDHIFKK